MDSHNSLNLGALTRNDVAQELKAHRYRQYNILLRQPGQKNVRVDFLIDGDAGSLSVIPIEVKSGKDYTIWRVG